PAGPPTFLDQAPLAAEAHHGRPEPAEPCVERSRRLPGPAPPLGRGRRAVRPTASGGHGRGGRGQRDRNAVTSAAAARSRGRQPSWRSARASPVTTGRRAGTACPAVGTSAKGGSCVGGGGRRPVSSHGPPAGTTRSAGANTTALPTTT